MIEDDNRLRTLPSFQHMYRHTHKNNLFDSAIVYKCSSKNNQTKKPLRLTLPKVITPILYYLMKHPYTIKIYLRSSN